MSRRTSPERVLRARVLAEPELARIRLAPIDVVGVDLRPAVGAGEDADLLLLQVLRLLDEAGDQVEVGDALGHPPVGEEIDGLDGGAHGRRLPLGLAGDHAVAQLDLVALHRLELEGGNVDQDVAILDALRGELAQPLLVGAQLGKARLCRDVQRQQGRLVDAARDAQPMIELEAAHGDIEVLAEAEAVGLPARQLATDHQPVAQQRHALVAVLGADHAVAGNGRPAAVADDALIALDGHLQRLDHDVAAQGRRVGAQVVDGLGPPARVVVRGAPRLAVGTAEPGNGLPPAPVGLLRRGPVTAVAMASPAASAARTNILPRLRPISSCPLSNDAYPCAPPHPPPASAGARKTASVEQTLSPLIPHL